MLEKINTISRFQPSGCFSVSARMVTDGARGDPARLSAIKTAPLWVLFFFCRKLVLTLSGRRRPVLLSPKTEWQPDAKTGILTSIHAASEHRLICRDRVCQYRNGVIDLCRNDALVAPRYVQLAVVVPLACQQFSIKEGVRSTPQYFGLLSYLSEFNELVQPLFGRYECQQVLFDGIRRRLRDVPVFSARNPSV